MNDIRKNQIKKRGICALAAAFLTAEAVTGTVSHALASDAQFLYNNDTVRSSIICRKPSDCNSRRIAYLNGDIKKKKISHIYTIKLQKGTFRFRAERMYNKIMENPFFDTGGSSVSYIYNADTISYNMSLYRKGKKIGKTYTLSFSDKGEKKANIMQTGKWKIKKNGTYCIKIKPCRKSYGTVYFGGYFINEK